MMEGGRGSSSRKISVPISDDRDLSDIVLKWSLEDVFNRNLFKVNKVPESFESVEQYLVSYVDPLLEETRAQLCSNMEVISRAPYAEVTAFTESKPPGSLLYDVKVDQWKNMLSSHGKEPYKTLPGDVVILADAKPETVSDLQTTGRTWTFALVKGISDDENEDDSTSTHFKVQASKEVEVSDGMWNSLFVIFLTNITTNRRIWNALHMRRNLHIIKEVLSPDYGVIENCGRCYMNRNEIWDDNILTLLSTLNESQSEAVLASLHKVRVNNKPYVDLIWGPPGTGKTKTVSVLLYSLLRMKCRTLTCTPTNVAITEVASRVLKLVREAHETDSSAADASVYSIGDILLFGNKERLNVNSEVGGNIVLAGFVSSKIQMPTYAVCSLRVNTSMFRKCIVGLCLLLLYLKRVLNSKFVLCAREPELVNNIPRIGQLLNAVESKMQRLGSFLDQLFLDQNEMLEEVRYLPLP